MYRSRIKYRLIPFAQKKLLIEFEYKISKKYDLLQCHLLPKNFVRGRRLLSTNHKAPFKAVFARYETKFSGES